MIYKAEIFGDDPKNPVYTFLIVEENIVEAAIVATKELYRKQTSRKLRVAKIEEFEGEVIDGTMFSRRSVDSDEKTDINKFLNEESGKTIYKAEIFGEGTKKLQDIYIIFALNIIEAAISAIKKLNSAKSEKKLRVVKVEEIKGEFI